MLYAINKKINYWQRIFEAYILGRRSHLSFWHEKPTVNPDAFNGGLGEYYMTFYDKANYAGPFDENKIPLLDYQGKIGKQYNPIAIAQYGLGNYNLYKKNNSKKNLEAATRQADWLSENLEANKFGVKVWMHHFDWEYRDTLKAPWYSALAQGSGISLLVRIYKETGEKKYLTTAQEAFKSLIISTNRGGVLYVDSDNDYWLEESVVNPPTHILNGFLWTLFGVWDYYFLTKDDEAKDLFDKSIITLKKNLEKFDVGFWSLYEQSGTTIKMIASRFYHNLHIVQLDIMHNLTHEDIFKEYRDRWIKYRENRAYVLGSQLCKIVFKVFYY